MNCVKQGGWEYDAWPKRCHAGKWPWVYQMFGIQKKIRILGFFNVKFPHCLSYFKHLKKCTWQIKSDTSAYSCPPDAQALMWTQVHIRLLPDFTNDFPAFVRAMMAKRLIKVSILFCAQKPSYYLHTANSTGVCYYTVSPGAGMIRYKYKRRNISNKYHANLMR